MKRVSFFIDGFNLYHSLKDYTKDCRWLNLKSLCSLYLKDDEKLQDVYYFTALATWNMDKSSKHKNYIKMLEKEGVKIKYGKFKKVSRHCNTCNNEYSTHEEKRTDVNIALGLFRDAYLDKYDTAVILSADSDLIPPIEEIRALFLDKRIGVLTPVGRGAKELKEVSDFGFKIEKKHLYASLFEKSCDIRGETIKAPEKWLPKDC